MVALGGVGASIVSSYTNFITSLPAFWQYFINLLLITIVVVVYSILIWKFYRFIAKKDLIELNLKKYNRSTHPVLSKTIAGGFYIVEYLIVLPFLVCFWFAAFVIFLALLTKISDTSIVITISAVIIVAIRMTSYYKEDLSKDLAKMLPFTLLSVAILQGGVSFQEGLTRIFQLPQFFSHIYYALFFIFIIEFILRLFETVFVASGIEEEAPEAPVPKVIKA